MVLQCKPTSWLWASPLLLSKEGNSFIQFSSVQSLSRVLLLWPHELQHARPPCPLPTPGVHSDSHPLSQWCHPTDLSCHSFLLLPSIFLSIRVFSNESALCIKWPKYWNFIFGISPSNEYSGLISLGLTGLISLQSQGLSRVFSNTTARRHQNLSLLYGPKFPNQWN